MIESDSLNDVRRAAAQAFQKMHSGRSVDDVVIDNALNEAFLRECANILPKTNPAELNWALMNLRKSGGLGSVTTKCLQQDPTDYLHAAEIAARSVEDRLDSTIDRIFCSPVDRCSFDEIATSIAPDVSTYQLRKAVGLRKKRQLKPELIKRIADWNTRVVSHTASDLYADKKLIPTNPGVYLFRDNSGYLYIGEAESLRPRVWRHLDHSDRKALCHYLFENGIEELSVDLHVFDGDSKGRLVKYRRAYESDLIAARKPRFNQRP